MFRRMICHFYSNERSQESWFAGVNRALGTPTQGIVIVWRTVSMRPASIN